MAGVITFTFMLVCAMGHCVKPLRCVSRLLTPLTWICFFILFFVTQIYYFRAGGQLCSGADDNFAYVLKNSYGG